MKTFSSARLIVLSTLACGMLATPHFAMAQPEAPAGADAPQEKKAKKPKADKKPREKGLAPRVIEATEAALGKPISPEQMALLTTSLRERDALIKEANDAYYKRFALVTGLSAKQAKEIDKPGRNGKDGGNAGKAEVKTDMDELTEMDGTDAAPVTPQ